MKTAAGRKKKIASFVEMLKNGRTIYPRARHRPEPLEPPQARAPGSDLARRTTPLHEAL
jgi:hypothetical protein